jgi:hypothetical protein
MTLARGAGISMARNEVGDVLRRSSGGEALNEMTLATVHRVGEKCAHRYPRKAISMRTSVKFLAVCAGAPAVALYVGAPAAWAAPSTAAHVTQQTTHASLSVSAGGHTLVQVGNESKATTTGPSLAVAFNRPGAEGSTADANGRGNLVMAGNDSSASATGNSNMVLAVNKSDADVTGNSNMVLAVNKSDADVTGNFNMVRAIDNSHAEVTGNNNMATALCGGSAQVSHQNNQIVLKAPCLGQ